jgi:hypothetical protein
MSPLTAFKLIEGYAIMYTRGSVKQAIHQMDKSLNRLQQDQKEAFYIYKEWDQRMNAWLEYIK